VLVLSTDPAHSLADAFAKPLRHNRATHLRRGLSARELDATNAVSQWIARRRPELARLLEHGTLLDREDAEQALSLPVPGLDELAAFLTINELAGRGEYDEIVVDTAPTGHTLRLLDAAEVVSGFTELLQAMHDRERMVAEALGGDIGVSNLVEELRRDAAAVKARLHHPVETRILWVTVPEPVAIAETARAIDWLLVREFPLAAVVVNRLGSATAGEEVSDCLECRARDAYERGTVAPLAKAISARRSEVPIYALPNHPGEPRGSRGLAPLGRLLADSPGRFMTRASRRTPAIHLHPRPSHDRCLAAELAAGRLLLFGGKGGVGKTTCATATALAIASSFPERPVRLLSTDPAPSLGDALSLAVGDSWTQVPGAGRLEARELDAGRQFEEYRTQYRDAVETFFDNLRGGSSFDAIADRAVFSRLFSLAPPGIDELVALITVIDLVEQGPDGLLIVDTAPTGHVLRLLSSQSDLRAWLDLLMRVLVKYQLAARAETFVRQLVDLSRGLRALSVLLADPSRARFVTVVRPAALPRLETVRLMAQLKRFRVGAHAVIVNAETVGTCRACRRRAWVEARELRALRRRCHRASGRCDIIHAPLHLPPPQSARELLRWSTTWHRDGEK
jgi:arsenite-transporting ATPase